MVLRVGSRDNARQMVSMPTPEEFTALQTALADALKRNESLAGELRVTRTERDLLKEQLNKFKRQLFAASSEATGQHQKDMFFNEAESLGAQAAPAAEETQDDKIDVPGHKRAKRGRKPLDPALPREVVHHELPDDERMCPHDGAALREIGVEVSEQMDIIPQQVRVIRHERVKYACPCCDGGMRLAARPPQIIPRGCSLRVRWPEWPPPSTWTGCRCTGRRCCWGASGAPTSRATRWPAASCAWGSWSSR